MRGITSFPGVAALPRLPLLMLYLGACAGAAGSQVPGRENRGDHGPTVLSVSVRGRHGTALFDLPSARVRAYLDPPRGGPVELEALGGHRFLVPAGGVPTRLVVEAEAAGFVPGRREIRGPRRPEAVALTLPAWAGAELRLGSGPGTVRVGLFDAEGRLLLARSEAPPPPEDREGGPRLDVEGDLLLVGGLRPGEPHVIRVHRGPRLRTLALPPLRPGEIHEQALRLREPAILRGTFPPGTHGPWHLAVLRRTDGVRAGQGGERGWPLTTSRFEVVEERSLGERQLVAWRDEGPVRTVAVSHLVLDGPGVRDLPPLVPAPTTVRLRAPLEAWAAHSEVLASLALSYRRPDGEADLLLLRLTLRPGQWQEVRGLPAGALQVLARAPGPRGPGVPAIHEVVSVEEGESTTLELLPPSAEDRSVESALRLPARESLPRASPPPRGPRSR
jgi:hypothetical protein